MKCLIAVAETFVGVSCSVCIFCTVVVAVKCDEFEKRNVAPIKIFTPQQLYYLTVVSENRGSNAKWVLATAVVYIFVLYVWGP